MHLRTFQPEGVGVGYIVTDYYYLEAMELMRG